MVFDLAAVASAAASPTVCLSHASYTAAGAITRDCVAEAAGRGGYLTAMVKVVYFRPACSNFDYRLLTGKYTIDYRLWKKFESSILSLGTVTKL